MRALFFVSAFLLSASSASAQPAEPGSGSARLKGSVYLDDDDTQIYTTLLDGDVALPGATRAGAHALVDVISTASVDVVSAATGRFDEVRIEGGLEAGWQPLPELDVSAALVRSQENDWLSYSPSATAAIDLFQKNTRLSIGYGFGHNQVGRASDPSFDERLYTHTIELGATQVIDQRSLVGLSYTLQRGDGWQSSPYRYVTTMGGAYSVLERHPDERLRHALGATGLRFLTKGIGLEASYRFYFDDWGVMSHTAGAGLRFDFLEHFDARVRARGYYQAAADFWRESYEAPLEYMSADRELSSFWDAGGGIKLGWHDERWTVDVKADALYYRYLDFARLDGRLALVTDAGVGLSW